MSSPLVPDGTYKIYSVAFSGVTVNLVDGAPSGAVSGYQDETSPNEEWIVRNNGDNNITLESKAATGNYATVTVATDAAPLYAGPSPTVWKVVIAGDQIFYLQDQDGTLVWNLPSAVNEYTILLRNTTNHLTPEAQWSFVPQN